MGPAPLGGVAEARHLRAGTESRGAGAVGRLEVHLGVRRAALVQDRLAGTVLPLPAGVAVVGVLSLGVRGAGVPRLPCQLNRKIHNYSKQFGTCYLHWINY